MLFPLLIGVAMKLVSLIPIVLGKLALIGGMALIASKLSLLLSGITILKKLFRDADGGMSQQGQYYHDGHYMYYGGDGQQAYQRMVYGLRGRQIGDQEQWTALVRDGNTSLVANSDNRGSVNQKAVEKSNSQGYLAQSGGDEGSHNVRGLSGNMYIPTNGRKMYTASNYRKTKYLKLREAADTIVVESERKIGHETDQNTANFIHS
jgi:hypothetical protein